MTRSSADSAQQSDLLTAIYDVLSKHYGPQRWWPMRTDSVWEIMLGAVLVQHTTWTNVESAFRNVISAWGMDGLRSPELFLQAPAEQVQALLKPAGFYTAKPRKVQSLARFVVDAGGVAALRASTEETSHLRERLLAIWGIGPETADAILLYALDRPIFVADAYALRLCARWGLLAPRSTYEQIQALFMNDLPHETGLFNEYHALLVAHGKGLCRPKPFCEQCPLSVGIPVSDGTTWSCPKLNTDKRHR